MVSKYVRTLESPVSAPYIRSFSLHVLMIGSQRESSSFRTNLRGKHIYTVN